MKHELFVSGEVLAELSDPDFIDRKRALEFTSEITQLSLTQEVWKFAQFLVDEKVMPGPSIQGDAIHVAIATVYEMDFVLSWNVKHLANPNKKTHFAVICMRAGLVPPTLVTPDMLY